MNFLSSIIFVQKLMLVKKVVKKVELVMCEQIALMVLLEGLTEVIEPLVR